MLPSLSIDPRLGSVGSRALSAAQASPSGPVSVAGSEYLPRPLPESRRVGPWILESLLAEGPLTSVYQARPAVRENSSTVGQYALKMLHSKWENDRTAIAQLRGESIVGQSVSNRHIVSVVSAHLHAAPFYFVMPLFEGTNVGKFISRERPLDPPLALWIARQTAEALDALHTLGYTHGDIKPANLIMARNGHLLLVDLGSARRLDEEPTIETPIMLGTPNYLAPECFCGSAGDQRSDLYSLGICLFELLTGRLPISTDDLSAVAAFKRQGAMPNVRIFRPNLPQEIAEVIRELTARDPLRRPQHAREAVQQLIRLEISTLRQRVPA
jgi:serine/threonine protein kinase